MRNRRKWLSLLLALALVLGWLPQLAVPAQAAGLNGDCGDSLEWNLNQVTGELSITGTGDMWDWGTSETAATPWRAYADDIQRVTIEEGVTGIGDGAFLRCKNLTWVSFPDSLKRIGSRAFYDCPYVDFWMLPNGLTSIGDEAFSRCGYLAGITIPPNVKRIGTAAFANISTLERTITILSRDCAIGDREDTLNNPANTTVRGLKGSTAESYAKRYGYSFETIGEPFGECGDGATWSLDLETGEMTIDGYGDMWDWGEFNPSPWSDFHDSITSVKINYDVTSIGSLAFAGCRKLTDVTIPRFVTSIGEEAFCWCYDLKNVNIPDTVTDIREGAFANCSSLTDITIPTSVRFIGENAFYNCEQLTEITVYSEYVSIHDNLNTLNDAATTVIRSYKNYPAEEYAYKYGYVFEEITDPAGTCGDGVRWTIDLPTGMLTISGRGAMDDYSPDTRAPWYPYEDLIKAVTVEPGVMSVGSYAFDGCSDLGKADIGYTVSTIGSHAFTGCSLGIICIMNRDCDIFDDISALGGNRDDKTLVRSYEDATPEAYARKYGYDFEEIVDPEGTFGDGMTWTISLATGEMTITGSGDMPEWDMPDDVPWYYQNIMIKTLTVSEGITSIGSYAFYGSTLEKVNLPDSLVKIGEYAFHVCNLRSVVIPDHVQSIGPGAFSACHKLVNVSIPEGVKSVGMYAFTFCGALKRVAVPASVTEIGDFAFGYYIDYNDKDMPKPYDDFVMCGYAETDADYYARAKDFPFEKLAYSYGTCGPELNWTLETGPRILTVAGAGEMWDDVPPPWDKDLSRELTIQNGVTAIGSHSFSSALSLTDVTVPNWVSSIGDGAFYGCCCLTDIRILNKDCQIGDDPDTLGDYELTVIHGYQGSTAEDYARRYGYRFEEIADPGGTFGNGMTWTISAATGELTITGSGDMPDWGTPADAPWYDYKDMVRTLTIGSGITAVGSNVFRFYSSIKEVNLPDSLEKIGDDAFSNCSVLRSVVIPDNVKTIGDYAFQSCLNLVNVSIPEGVQHIGDYAFTFCPALSGAAIPESVTEIGEYAFGCYIDYEDHLLPKPYADFVIYGYAGTEAEAYADAIGIPFELLADSSGKCGPDVSWTLDGKTRELTVSGTGKMWDDVPPPWDKDLIREITIGDGITGIGNYSFSGCLSLKEVTIPEGVDSIGDGAFYDCSCLTDVTILNPDCVIDDHPGTLGDSDVTVIHGNKGSTAEAYANRYGYRFAPLDPFEDVLEGMFCYEPVRWAVNHKPQITKGTDDEHFSPDATCTRGQVVTFLWRAKGCPEPTKTDNPFKDVKQTAYYYKAVLWAVENGVTNGIDKTHFGPDKGCTRAQVVTFLWRAENKPKPGSSANPFKDVTGGYYYDAVLWAVEKNITKGTAPNKFSPDATCTRGQIVTFLYRDMT